MILLVTLVHGRFRNDFFKATMISQTSRLSKLASAEGGTSFAEIWTPENSYNPDLSSYDKLIYNIRGGDGNDYLWIDSIDVFNWAVNHGEFYFNGGAGNDAVQFEEEAGAVVNSLATRPVLNGGKGFDTLVVSTHVGDKFGDEGLKGYGRDWDHVLNHSKNFEQVIVKEYLDDELRLKDKVVKDSKKLDFVILADLRDASALTVQRRRVQI